MANKINNNDYPFKIMLYSIKKQKNGKYIISDITYWQEYNNTMFSIYL